MKKYIVIFLLFLVLGVQAQNRERIEAAPSFTWYGLDFTYARMVGTDVDFSTPAAIVTQFFDQWNQLFIAEPQKYDLRGAFIKQVINDLSNVTERNATVDYLELVTDTPNTIAIEDVNEIISAYSGDEGIGLLFIIENFDKPAKKVRFWVVLFDVQTHDVLLAKQTENAVGGGFGFRNYWASGLYSGIKNIKVLYPGWLKSLN